MTRTPIILSVTLLILIGSCKKNETEEVAPPPAEIVIPTCIQSIIDSSNKGLSSIYVQEEMNENHYWLSTQAFIIDADQYIVNAQCDTVCVIGGWLQNECELNYEDSLWEVIWES